MAPSMTERGRRAARSVAQPFGLCRRDTLRPARRMQLYSMTRPPVWHCATLEPQRVAATQRGAWRESKQALRRVLHLRIERSNGFASRRP